VITEGGGKTLMPGLIDAHWHSLMAAMPLSSLMPAGTDCLKLRAGAEAGGALMLGFTIIRDCGRRLPGTEPNHIRG
jgi:imidazolonepropionase-like amidohydrolase